jgi:cell wall-associated NlpC family hydrolase
MKITRIEIHLIRAPFDMGAAPTAFAGMNWASVDSLFVRVCTDAGLEGLGEGWCHVACTSTSAALATLVGPAFIGRDISDRSRLMAEMAHRFHIHGRTGPVVYAMSAIEIALWDIAGKQASQPIATLLGGAPRELTAYASLLRYAEPALIASAIERALAQGFRHIKLHEVRLDTVRAARAACGESTWLRAALFLLRPGFPRLAASRRGFRARGRVRTVLRRPAGQPLPRRGARAQWPAVGSARPRPGARSGHGRREPLPARRAGRDRGLMSVCRLTAPAAAD